MIACPAFVVPGVKGIKPFDADPLTPHLRRHASAVCLMFCKPSEGSHAEILFTKRSTKLSSHKGQISFPGGHYDAATDQSLWDTCRREINEEISLPSDQLFPLGLLEPMTSLSGNIVLPFIAWTNLRLDQMRPSPTEVELLFSVPSHQLTRKHAQRFSFKIFGQKRTSFLFADSPAGNIWGLTAQILFNADIDP